MSKFNELIKNFDKIRDYMREFYIYGFKMRGDYTYKSARTYDNERRRIESWLSKYIQWDYTEKGKRVFISVDSSKMSQNPLYAVWKSKSFTKSDISLHFYLLDILSDGRTASVEELTETLCEQSGVVWEPQTVRGKLKEYEKNGILTSIKQGRALRYTLAQDILREMKPWKFLLAAVKFFQEAAPFGFIGSTLLDAENLENDIFRFKHAFIVHTLEDSILFELLSAMEQRKDVCLENHSRRTGNTTVLHGIPLKILTSTQHGRRYVCLYLPSKRRFLNVRLDSITTVMDGNYVSYYEEIKEKLKNNLPRCWGVSFGNHIRDDFIFMKLSIDEKREYFLLDRLKREGRGGEILRVDENVFLYSMKVFDSNEMLPWIKTFLGRILSLEGGDSFVIDKFYNDIDSMYKMYFEEE